jgi:methyl acetate hydrolase
MDEALRQATDAGDVPGVVALAADDRGVVYEGAFGRRDVARGPAMTLDTVFWIASMTKAVTTVAALQLVEAGRLALDRPLGDLVPQLAAPQVLEGFDETGRPRLRPARRPITLRHLLTHTAGFSYDIWNADIGRCMEREGIPDIITCRNDALRTPLVFDPGERWEYGIGIDLVGKAVEQVSGRSLEEQLRERILDPLGMADTGFTITPGMRARLASVHARKPDGSLEPIAFELPQPPEFFMGGGGLYATGGDYLRFLRMLLHGGELDGVRILGPETVAAMGRNQIGDLVVGPLQTARPEASNDVEVFPGMVKKWGLGFLINTDAAPTGRSAGSLTWGGLANTYYWIDPTRRIAGVFLTQILPFGDAEALSLAGRFERAVYARAG